MLLHDSFFQSSNKSLNTTHYGIITIAYSPLFHSTFTLMISIFGLLINLICCIKIWFIIYKYRQRKLKKNHKQQQQQLQQQQSMHILSHDKYRFLLILTSNDCLLCLLSIISCLDEKFFFQSFLARHHLCGAHIFLWKFTLHFIPLLIICILCRYHYILNKNFEVKSSNLSTLHQLLCTDLSILIPFVLALAWSVDGLWLWGVANIKDYIHTPSSSSSSSSSSLLHNENGTTKILTSSSINENHINTTLLVLNRSSYKTEEQNDNNNFYLPEQKIICHLQINHNFHFSVRLLNLIRADYVLLFFLHLIGLFLEIFLHIRLCCCIIIKKITLSFDHERQLCIYILYIFIIITLTSLPFYFYRPIETIFDIQFTSINNDFINSRTFSQILLSGACFKPLLVFILFFPSSILFKIKCYLKCYSPTNIQIIEDDKQIFPSSNNQNHIEQQQKSINHSQYHRFSLFTRSSHYPKFHSKLRTQSNPIISMDNSHQNSLSQTEQFHNWLKLSNSIIVDKTNETSNTIYV